VQLRDNGRRIAEAPGLLVPQVIVLDFLGEVERSWSRYELQTFNDATKGRQKIGPAASVSKLLANRLHNAQ
jgi:hypothetical protein